MWPEKKEIPESYKLKTSEQYYIWEVKEKKQESEYKRASRKPKAHQLMVWTYSAEGLIDDQADTNFTSSEEDSFCLQMKSKSMQAKKK